MQHHNLHAIYHLFPISQPIPLYYHHFSHYTLQYTIYKSLYYPLKLTNNFSSFTKPQTFPYNTFFPSLQSLLNSL